MFQNTIRTPTNIQAHLYTQSLHHTRVIPTRPLHHPLLPILLRITLRITKVAMPITAHTTKPQTTTPTTMALTPDTVVIMDTGITLFLSTKTKLS